MNRIVNSIEAKDIENHFHPYTNPQVLKEFIRMLLVRRRYLCLRQFTAKFIEGMSGLWCASLGFNNMT